MCEVTELYWCPECKSRQQHLEAMSWIACMGCGTVYDLHIDDSERKARRERALKEASKEIGRA